MFASSKHVRLSEHHARPDPTDREPAPGCACVPRGLRTRLGGFPRAAIPRMHAFARKPMIIMLHAPR